MRLVYFGSGEFGLPTLKRLVEEHHVALLVTQPDRPAGRHRLLRPTPACHFAQDHNIETIKPADIGDPQVQQRIHAAGADAFVVIAYGQKLPGALLDHAFAINLHGSLLPRYRGAAPINWAIINGENETGLSVIRITQRIDAGDILAQRATAIDTMETAGELECRLAEIGAPVVLETLANFESGRLQPTPQDERLATRAPKLAKDQGTVRFDQPAGHVQSRVHGLRPWPGCRVRLDGLPLRLSRVEVGGTVGEDVAPGDPEHGVLL
ncbi:MAG: methionyl-tRNA formyltransferase, partial [Planctomycetota bacterium]|nr:methionyl-tRNA formyltransferase [Planctomycetota bacterium]